MKSVYIKMLNAFVYEIFKKSPFVFIKQDPQDTKDLLECQVEMDQRETKEIRVFKVSRESRDKRVNLDNLDFLYVIRLFSI